jgi:hypothetical protein
VAARRSRRRWLKPAMAEAKAGRGGNREGARRRESAAGRDVFAGQAAHLAGRVLALCEETGTISSPSPLRDYFHNIGAVFYREGLFGDAIILDQVWALEAVYAMFHSFFRNNAQEQSL